jgi:hypothetical protein
VTALEWVQSVIFITTYQLQTIHVSVLEYLFTIVFNCDSSLCFLLEMQDLFSRHKVAAGSCHLENKLDGLNKLNYLVSHGILLCPLWFLSTGGKKKIVFCFMCVCVCVCCLLTYLHITLLNLKILRSTYNTF